MVVIKYEHSTASDGWPDWSLESVHDLMSRNVWKCELTLNNALQSGILITLPRFPVTRSLHIFVTGVWIKSCQAAMKYLKPDSQIIFIEIQKGCLCDTLQCSWGNKRVNDPLCDVKLSAVWEGQGWTLQLLKRGHFFLCIFNQKYYRTRAVY